MCSPEQQPAPSSLARPYRRAPRPAPCPLCARLTTRRGPSTPSPSNPSGSSNTTQTSQSQHLQAAQIERPAPSCASPDLKPGAP
jgi:hypothetical protein